MQRPIDALERTQTLLAGCGIRLTDVEKREIELTDFGLADYPRSGLQLLTYINTPRYCAKELVLFPHQTCPEHLHPPFDDTPGKQETFRCRWGEVYLFVDDDALTLNTERGNPVCQPPAGFEQWYTCQRYILLRAGEQYTIKPNTRHWFQAGKLGAVVSEFSSQSLDDLDVFTDPNVRRVG
ncbi:D-lyxose/D-mannose family sugar isomerase [Serratia fonticola]|uniref:D-lyxose/D-mannose family sugar isomerase n=1 Tax=Serratia fonticola TaxID=47917 RepID=UPI002178D51B|nr:D-lyxose/D-mannose family sugar isomerase [Serratia fonticola]CAI0777394.1 D-lyxose ketol-isomerase [Serratia fonticola]